MITQIRPAQLSAWLASASVAGRPVVLDVREPAELRIASITGGDFTLVAIPMGSIAARLSELEPNRPVACLCHHGGRSMQVASFLDSRGFCNVANISGGIHAWAEELDQSIPRY